MSEQDEQLSAATPSSDQKNIALLVHLSGIILGFIPSLIVYLIKQSEGPSWLLDQVKEALNFQITILIAFIVCWVLAFVVIGALLMPLVWLINLVLCIVAAVKVSNGASYRYPFALRLIK